MARRAKTLQKEALDICTGTRIAIAIEASDAVHFSKSFRGMAVGVKTCCARTRGRLGVDVHAHELELESVEMRNVRDEVHEIRKLSISQHDSRNERERRNLL